MPDELAALLDQLVKKSQMLAALGLFEAIELRRGASPASLTKLEAHYGRPIPSDLYALLLRTDGAPRLLGFFDLLSVEEMLPGSEAFRRGEALKASLADRPNLLPKDALIFADKGGDRPDCIYVDRDGQVVTFDADGTPTREETVTSLLERASRRLDWLLEDAGGALTTLEVTSETERSDLN